MNKQSGSVLEQSNYDNQSIYNDKASEIIDEVSGNEEQSITAKLADYKIIEVEK